MNRYKVIILVLLLQSANYLVGQNWPKEYITNDGNYPFSVIEHYDRGYLVGGWFVTSDGFLIDGLLMKTTINGGILWRKRIGGLNDETGILDVNQTLDGGVILSGLSCKYDPWGDPVIIKLNSCGEID